MQEERDRRRERETNKEKYTDKKAKKWGQREKKK